MFQQNNTLHEFYLAFATLATYEYFAFGCGHCLSKHSYDTLRHKLYKLRIAPCFALPQSYRDRLRRSVAAFAPPHHTLCVRMWLTARAYSDFARSRFILIPVAFEIASGLLRALRVRRVPLRFRRAYTVIISLRSCKKGSWQARPRTRTETSSWRAPH